MDTSERHRTLQSRCFCLLVLASVCVSAAGLPEQPSRGLIFGKVVDATTGQPLRNSTVTLSGTIRLHALTDGDGQFVFPDLRKGDYLIYAFHSEYMPGGYGQDLSNSEPCTVAVEPDGRVSGLTIRLQKYGRASGNITDERGESIGGVRVHALKRSIVSGYSRFVDMASASSDDTGTFSVRDLPPGDYVFGVLETYTTTPTRIADEIAKIGIEAPQFADIWQIGESTSLAGGLHIGEELIGMPPEPLLPRVTGERLWIYPTVYYPGSAAIATASLIHIEPDAERVGVDIRATPVQATRVSGVASGPTGPASLVAVRLLEMDEAVSRTVPTRAATLTDRTGRFALWVAPNHAYQLRILKNERDGSKLPTGTPSALGPGGTSGLGSHQDRPSDTYWARVPLQVGSGDVAEISVELKAGFSISGRVAFEEGREPPGKPEQSRLSIRVEPSDATESRSVSAKLDETLHFEAGGLSAGKYLIRLSGTVPSGWFLQQATVKGRNLTDRPFDLDSDLNDVVVNLVSSASISGVSGMVTAPSGQRVAEATVLIFPTDKTLWQGYGTASRQIRSRHASALARYEFTDVPGGEYFVLATADSLGDGWLAIDSLNALARLATRVMVRPGSRVDVDLTARRIVAR